MIVAHVPDLMDRSKVSAAAGGEEVVFVPLGQLADRAGEARLVVVDLARPGVLDVLAGLPPGLVVVGFGAHVEDELLRAAASVGCTTVLTRREFFRRLDSVLATGS